MTIHPQFAADATTYAAYAAADAADAAARVALADAARAYDAAQGVST